MSATHQSGSFEARGLLARVMARVEDLACLVAPPVLRVALALPFLRSGLTRWDGFLSISFGTRYLFEEQFKLHILGAVYDFPMPELAAPLAAAAEIILPILLIMGLFTRFSAFCLLIMTGVIQLVFPEAWVNFHLYWAALALAILALGPGRISVDSLFAPWLRRRGLA